MRIADIISHKGDIVVTTSARAGIREVLADLAEHNVGALVVTDSDGYPVGIVSERDIVRALAARGGDVLDESVAAIMTSDIVTTDPGDLIDRAAEIMTERRIRHMPVVADGRLAGIVTIGDVVSSQLRQLESDRQQLEAYISG